jgi:signal transduction histidine kinase
VDESSRPIERDEANMIEQSKKVYTRFIAHELRSPMTAIQGYAELIALAGPVNPTQEQFIRQIQACVQKINDLIGEISGNILTKP